MKQEVVDNYIGSITMIFRHNPKSFNLFCLMLLICGMQILYCMAMKKLNEKTYIKHLMQYLAYSKCTVYSHWHAVRVLSLS